MIQFTVKLNLQAWNVVWCCVQSGSSRKISLFKGSIMQGQFIMRYHVLALTVSGQSFMRNQSRPPIFITQRSTSCSWTWTSSFVFPVLALQWLFSQMTDFYRAISLSVTAHFKVFVCSQLGTWVNFYRSEDRIGNFVILLSY